MGSIEAAKKVPNSLSKYRNSGFGTKITFPVYQTIERIVEDERDYVQKNGEEELEKYKISNYENKIKSTGLEFQDYNRIKDYINGTKIDYINKNLSDEVKNSKSYKFYFDYFLDKGIPYEKYKNAEEQFIIQENEAHKKFVEEKNKYKINILNTIISKRRREINNLQSSFDIENNKKNESVDVGKEKKTPSQTVKECMDFIKKNKDISDDKPDETLNQCITQVTNFLNYVEHEYENREKRRIRYRAEIINREDILKQNETNESFDITENKKIIDDTKHLLEKLTRSEEEDRYFNYKKRQIDRTKLEKRLFYNELILELENLNENEYEKIKSENTEISSKLDSLKPTEDEQNYLYLKLLPGSKIYIDREEEDNHQSEGFKMFKFDQQGDNGQNKAILTHDLKGRTSTTPPTTDDNFLFPIEHVQKYLNELFNKKLDILKNFENKNDIGMVDIYKKIINSDEEFIEFVGEHLHNSIDERMVQLKQNEMDKRWGPHGFNILFMKCFLYNRTNNESINIYNFSKYSTGIPKHVLNDLYCLSEKNEIKLTITMNKMLSLTSELYYYKSIISKIICRIDDLSFNTIMLFRFLFLTFNKEAFDLILNHLNSYIDIEESENKKLKEIRIINLRIIELFKLKKKTSAPQGLADKSISIYELDYRHHAIEDILLNYKNPYKLNKNEEEVIENTSKAIKDFINDLNKGKYILSDKYIIVRYFELGEYEFIFNYYEQFLTDMIRKCKLSVDLTG
jgi:hypothetical protein